MSYYCCRRRDLQYTIKVMLCLRVQSHMWQTVAAFIGLTSLFGVPLSLVSHRQSKEKAAFKFIPHVRRCTPNSRKHNEQRWVFLWSLFIPSCTTIEKDRKQNAGWDFWLYLNSRAPGMICSCGLQSLLFIRARCYVRNNCSQYGFTVSESKMRSLVYPQDGKPWHIFFYEFIPCLYYTDSKTMC